MSKEYKIEDVEFEGVFIFGDQMGFVINWDSDMGFGMFKFSVSKEYPHNMIIDNELMSKDFIKAVLNKMVDKAILSSDK